MSRGTQLLQLVSRLRDELGRSDNVAVGVSDLSSLKSTIRRVYETLHEDYDWPHLRTTYDKVTLAAGQQFYDVPTTANGVSSPMNYDRIEKVVVWYSGLPHDLIRGIEFKDYAFYDSTTGVQTEPALKWDMRFTGVKEQIEIWPIPSSNTQSLQVIGFPKPKTLVNDEDTLDIDDLLVLEFAAYELLLRQDSKDAPAKLQQAQARYALLRARSKAGVQGYRLGMDKKYDPKNYRAVVRVR